MPAFVLGFVLVYTCRRDSMAQHNPDTMAQRNSHIEDMLLYRCTTLLWGIGVSEFAKKTKQQSSDRDNDDVLALAPFPFFDKPRPSSRNSFIGTAFLVVHVVGHR